MITVTPFIPSDFALGTIIPYYAAQAMPLPYFRGWIPAGFPSPAADWTEERLNLNELCIEHPAATYFVEVNGDSMDGAGIHTGDILVVDQAIENVLNRVVLAIVGGAFTVKRLIQKEGVYYLKPEHPEMNPYPIREGEEVEIRGVVTWALHSVS